MSNMLNVSLKNSRVTKAGYSASSKITSELPSKLELPESTKKTSHDFGKEKSRLSTFYETSISSLNSVPLKISGILENY